MKLNLKFYNGSDSYSDGDIEDKIIEYIKKYPDNYEKAFEEDSSWPVFYHLSDMRKNVIRWYPFEKNSTILEVGAGMGAITEELCRKCKKVTSIELSKKRATAILERNKNAKNLEIIVGNYKDIVLNEKYDYILLNGVLEYGKLYMDSENPYEDFIKKLKFNLKPSGKILIAIENKFGLKYWCGANEDHTNIPFDGINGYVQNDDVKTFSKNELEELAKKCELNINFYYLFPDYKFPKVVYTDFSIQKDLYTEYPPYYYTKMNLVMNEHNLFKEIYANKKVDFFANSYFIELSKGKEEQIVKYAKFNNEYRDIKYNFCTYLKDNKFYKEIFNQEAIGKLNEIKEIYNYLKDKGIKIAVTHSYKYGIYTDKIEGENLNNILINYYKNKDFENIYIRFDKLYKLIEVSCGNKIENTSNTIFDKYKMNISKKELEKMHFYENGIIDIIPNNIIVQNNEYILFDQEWYEKNVPIEYILYRAIYNTFYDIDKIFMETLFKKYNVNSTIFTKLENKFSESIKNNSYIIVSKLCNSSHYISNINELQSDNEKLIQNNNILKEKNASIITKNDMLTNDLNAKINENNLLINNLNSKIEEIEILKNEISSKINENENLKNEIHETTNENILLKQENESILNSKRYKFISYIADIKNKLLK